MSSDATTEDDNFEERAKRLAASAANLKNEIAQGSDENRASRLFIMRYVIYIYAGILTAIVAMNIISAIYSREWSAATKNVTEIAQVLILPIVTLVLGYYFGREGKENSRDRR